MFVKSLGQKVEKEDIKEIICNECESTLEYTKTDIQKQGSWHRIHVEESEWVGYEYVKCPICGRNNIIRHINESY